MWLISNRVWTRKICSASTGISIQCKLYSTNLNHWFVLGWERYSLTNLFDTMHERIIRVDISPVVLNSNNTKADVTVWPLKSLQYIPALVVVVSNDVNRHMSKCKNKNDDSHSIMSSLQHNCCLKVNFQKVDQHTRHKWLIFDTKQSVAKPESPLQNVQVE